MKSIDRVWYERTSLPLVFARKRHFAAGQKLRTPHIAGGVEDKGKIPRWSLSTPLRKTAYRAVLEAVKHKVYYRTSYSGQINGRFWSILLMFFCFAGSANSLLVAAIRSSSKSSSTK